MIETDVMKEVEVRKTGLDELDLLLDWRMKVLHAVFAGYKDVDWEALREGNKFYYIECIPIGRHVAMMAWIDGEPVGCGGVCYQQEMPSPDNPWCESAYLMNIYVSPAWRGQGIGKKIVRSLIEDARHKGIKKIYLETSDCGRQLYTDLGFRPLPDMMILKTKN